MNPFHRLIIKLMFSAMNADKPFVDGLLTALEEDFENREPDARQNVNTLLEKAFALNADATIKKDIELLSKLANLYERQTLVEKQRLIIEKILGVASEDTTQVYRTRIAYERISNLMKELENFTSPN